MNEPLDAVIIGTGQAGKPLAGALAEAGWRTVIVERGRVGGTCVIDGCTPTKTMIASARTAALARRSDEYGVETGRVKVDMHAARARKRKMVDDFSTGSEQGMRRHDTLELVFGEARFLEPKVVEVALPGGGKRRFEAPHIFINTGTRPAVPPVPGLDDVPYLDNASVMELDAVPSHLVILGGGFVGLEFAQMFRRFGAGVTVIEQAERIAGREDNDVADALASILEEDGIDVRTRTKVSRIEREGDRIAASIANGEGDARIIGSHLLVAAGRTPNTAALNLSAAGIETDDEGYVRVTDRLETTVPGVFALGDVNGGPPFTHASYDDYRIVRTNLLEEGEGRSTEDRLIPYTLFTDPELGRVGLTERQAREGGREVGVARMPMTHVARAVETGETRGFMKAVVDTRSGLILGAAVLGTGGGEIAALLQAAMMGKLPYTALRDAVFAHPTLAESLNNLFSTIE